MKARTVRKLAYRNRTIIVKDNGEAYFAFVGTKCVSAFGSGTPEEALSEGVYHVRSITTKTRKQ